MKKTEKAPHPTETRTVVNGVEYVVKSFFKEDARETAEQKFLRLVKDCVAAEIINTDGAGFNSN